MKLPVVLGVGFAVIILILRLRDSFSKRSVSKNSLVKFQEPRIPWLLIGFLRIIRAIVGVFVVFVGLVTLKMLFIGYSKISDVNSTIGGWEIGVNIVIILLPIILFCRFAGQIRNKINTLYQNGGGTSDLLIVRRWHF